MVKIISLVLKKKESENKRYDQKITEINSKKDLQTEKCFYLKHLLRNINPLSLFLYFLCVFLGGGSCCYDFWDYNYDALTLLGYPNLIWPKVINKMSSNPPLLCSVYFKI